MYRVYDPMAEGDLKRYELHMWDFWCVEKAFDVWICWFYFCVFIRPWRKKPEKKIGLGRLPQTQKITLFDPIKHSLSCPHAITVEKTLWRPLVQVNAPLITVVRLSTWEQEQYDHDACGLALISLVIFNGKLGHFWAPGGRLHIIKGTQNESFIIYIPEIGFMELKASIILLKGERGKTGSCYSVRKQS